MVVVAIRCLSIYSHRGPTRRIARLAIIAAVAIRVVKPESILTPPSLGCGSRDVDDDCCGLQLAGGLGQQIERSTKCRVLYS